MLIFNLQSCLWFGFGKRDWLVLCHCRLQLPILLFVLLALSAHTMCLTIKLPKVLIKLADISIQYSDPLDFFCLSCDFVNFSIWTPCIFFDGDWREEWWSCVFYCFDCKMEEWVMYTLWYIKKLSTEKEIEEPIQQTISKRWRFFFKENWTFMTK